MNCHTALGLAFLLFQSPPGILAGQTGALPNAWRPQYLPSALLPPASSQPQALHQLAAGSSPKPTHWREGGIVGAVVFGLALASLGGGLCADSETDHDCTGATILGAVAGGGMGFVIGALIGGLFPKGT